MSNRSWILLISMIIGFIVGIIMGGWWLLLIVPFALILIAGFGKAVS